MNPTLQESLWGYLHSRLPLTHPAVFINRYHNRVEHHNLKRILDRYAKKAGIDKHVTAHLLRHTFATALVEKNVDLMTVKELLGHASIETTQIYTHTSVSRMADAVKKLEPVKC